MPIVSSGVISNKGGIRMMVGNQAPADDPVLLEISRDDWILILDYIYNNLEYDSESDAKNDMIAAMDRIRNAHYFYNIERKDEPGLQ